MSVKHVEDINDWLTEHRGQWLRVETGHVTSGIGSQVFASLDTPVEDERCMALVLRDKGRDQFGLVSIGTRGIRAVDADKDGIKVEDSSGVIVTITVVPKP